MNNNNETNNLENATYEQFLDLIKSMLSERLEEGITIVEKEQLKNNSTVLKGLIFKKADENIAPTLYMNSFFDRYLSGESIETIVDEILDCYEAAPLEPGADDIVLNAESKDIYNNLFFRLINKESNSTLLAGVPYREYLDLAITYHWRISSKNGVVGSVMITNELLEKFKLTEEKLYKHAIRNTGVMFPYKLSSMAGIVSRMMGMEEEEIAENMKGIEDYPMYVVSNNQMLNGASVWLLPEFSRNMNVLFPEGYYVIPSSIHELIILPSENDPESLLQMIHEVNRTQVPREDFLSDNLYKYDPNRDEFEVIMQKCA